MRDYKVIGHHEGTKHHVPKWQDEGQGMTLETALALEVPDFTAQLLLVAEVRRLQAEKDALQELPSADESPPPEAE